MAELLDVEISENVTAALDQALAATGDMTPAMGEIARFLATQTRLRFREQRDPLGVPWKPSLRVTGYVDADGNRVEGDGGETLTLSGDLRRSIKEDWGADYAAAGPEASGGAAVYAKIHQFGGTIRPKRQADGTPHVMTRSLNTPFGRFASVTIPARPYLGWNDESEAGVLDILADHVRETFNPERPIS